MKSPEDPTSDVTEEDDLGRCRRLLSSLSAPVFQGQVVSHPLQTRHPDRPSRRPGRPDSSHPLSSDLLRRLSQTLSDALSLSLSPAVGRLRTRSDLDSLSAALDRLASDADLLLKSGVLRDPPPSDHRRSDGREAVRSEARTIVTRLQIGTTESRAVALDSLLGLMSADDKNVMIVAAQGAASVLVRLIDSSSASPETREKAVSAITRISTVDSCKHVLIAEGVILLNHLVRALDPGGSSAARRDACVALRSLSLSRDNARAIGGRGGVSGLLDIARSGTPSSQAVAAAVLKNLAAVPEVRQNLVDEDCVPILVGLANSGTAEARENSIGCLCNLASDEGDQEIKLLIVRSGGIDCVRDYWDAAPSPSERCLEPAAALVRNLSMYKYVAEIVVSAGFVARLVAVLEKGSTPGARSAAAGAIYEAAYDAKTKRGFGEAGGIRPLVRMLEAKSMEEREAAAKALACLLTCSSNRRLFRKDEAGVYGAVQLLDASIVAVDKRYPIAILGAVSESRRCRKQMVAAGGCGYLRRLAEMEVESAKRLLETLEKGKLWGVFPRS
ncbi:hypothetical protein QJS10_CPB04g00149 [Acorus calamus]|uniref:ARM repeat superfamily protein n=1 Tax=Acorus calamus TaxID=4465 RepID=A0AAV9F0G9_ACOCL|nr:hypothetical protein QJS10_CPB04g00149 [Acorus calamus]